MLEDNRDLLNDITHRECSKEGAAQLPKLLFDIISKAEVDNNKNGAYGEDEQANLTESAEGSSSSETICAPNQETKISSAQEIIRNLPKVWKVLVELLNHQKTQQVDFNVRSCF